MSLSLPTNPRRHRSQRPWRAIGLATAASLCVAGLSFGTVDARDDTPAKSTAIDTSKLSSELRSQIGFAELGVADAEAQQFRVIVHRTGSDADAAGVETLSGQMRVITQYQTIPAFSAEVDRTALADLSADTDVEWIETMPTAQRTDAEALALTGGDQAHAAGFTGAGSTIAVIDDGIDSSHPAFGGDFSYPNDKVVGGADFGDFDTDPRIDCTGQFHGTPVSGIAAGNGGGVTGAAPDAQLVHVKVQSASNCGGAGLDGDIVGAMDWVVANQATFGIDVMSMSLGSGQSFTGTCDSYITASASIASEAKARGIVIVAASGNGASKSAMSWPACLSDVVSVGSVYDANIGSRFFSVCGDPSTAADQVTCYSNSSPALDILAPSEAAETAAAGGGLISFGGTSSATPFAAGLFAVLAAEAPSATPDELIALVEDTGVPIQDPGNGSVRPRVDFVGALNAL